MLDNKIKRKDNESFKHYQVRLYRNKEEYELTNKEIAIILDEVSGRHLGESTYRGFAKAYIEGYDDAISENIKDNKILDELDQKKLDLNLERKKLQSQKVEINRWIREKSRIELYIEEIKDSISKLSPLQIPKFIDRANNDKVALLNVTDTHIGKKGVVKGLKGEILNEYNFDIFQERMWKLFNETIHIIKKENINTLYFLCEGDLIDGILRNSQLQSLQFGVVDSVIKASEFLSNYINELSEHCNIEYYSAHGNHDNLRLLNAKSSGDFPNENVGRLVDTYLENRLKDNKNIHINNNNLPYSLFNVFGLNIMISHGEDKNLEKTIKDYMAMYNERIDLLITGHLHSSYNQSIGIGNNGDIEVIRIPSICGIDDFSQKIHKFSKAGSKVIILEKGRGKTITYDIKLN